MSGVGMTIRELIDEIRDDIRALSDKVNRIEGRMVSKEELAMWRKIIRSNRRWAVTTIISLAILGIMVLGYVSSLGG